MQADRTVFVTGASSGLGLVVARDRHVAEEVPHDTWIGLLSGLAAEQAQAT